MKSGYSTFSTIFFRQIPSTVHTVMAIAVCLSLSGLSYGQLSVSINYSVPNCADFNSGLATAQPTGGTAPYNYYWNNGQTGQTVSNPSPGALSVTVTDADFSSANAAMNVAQPQELVVVVAGAPDPCAPTGNFLRAEVTGGAAPYNYQWSNGGSGDQINGLTEAGFFFVTVTDFNGCIKVGGGEYAPPVQASLFLNPSICGGTCDGSIEAKIDAGSGPFAFAWSYGPQPTSQQQFPAPEGQYTVTVTDDLGCTDVVSGLLDDPDPLEISFNLSNACGAPTNATAEVTGGTAPYTYSWFNGGGGPTAYNLQSGEWVLTVHDAHGCALSQYAAVTNSDLSLEGLSTPAACAGQNSGTATVSPTGGSGTYTYAWSNGATAQSLDGLEAGEYTVTVGDGTGCEQVATVEVEEAISFTVSTQATPYRCEGQGGTASVSIDGGSGNFSYTWNDSAGQSGSEATNLDPGTYEVVVADADGCEQAVSIDIPDASISPSANALAASCEDNGSIQVSVGNAVGTPTFEWSNGSTEASPNNLAAGLYTVTVTDADGCKDELEVEVPDESFEVSLAAAQQGCEGEDVGIVEAEILGGNPNTNYTYAWSNWGQSNTIGGLVPGTYEVTVSDPSGCEVVASFELTPSPPIEAEMNTLNTPCGGLSNGTIELNTAGAAPFTYQWSTGSTEANLGNLAAGQYSVIVTDANGCTKEIELGLEEEDMEIAAAITPPTCDDTPNGTASVEITANGTGPFSYEWSNDESGVQITDLTAGQYTVTVTDANGCVSVEAIEIEPSVQVEVDFAWAALGCDDNGVTVDLNGTSDNASTWTWTLGNGEVFTGQNPQILFEQSPMDVTLTVTSPEGCEASAIQSVEAAPISLTLTPEATLCQSEEFTFDLQVGNAGTDPLNYVWTPADLVVSGQGTPNPVFAASETGEYNVNVEVSNGSCTVNAQALMSVAEVVTVDPAAVSFSQCQDLSVDFQNTGGVAGTWYFNYPDPTMTSEEQNPTFIYPTEGQYEVVFEPSANCAENLALQVEVQAAPEVAFTVAAEDCDDPITVVFTNSSNVVLENILWDFGPLGTSTEENPTLTLSGSQTVSATLTGIYNAGCEQTVVDEISVESFTPPALENLTGVCTGGETAELNPGGDPSFSYEWTGGALGTSSEVNPTVTVNETTVYTVIITAANGCSTAQEVTVEVPAEAFALLPIDDIISCSTDAVTVEALTNSPATEWEWAIDEGFENSVGEEANLTIETSNLPITYFLLATNEFGCTDVTSFTAMNAAISIEFDDAFNVCKGDMLEFNVTLGNAELSDITNWQPFDPLASPIYANEDFTFEITNDEGCMGFGEMTVKAIEFTEPLELSAEPEEVWQGQSTQLLVTENEEYSYEWTPAETLDDPTSASPIATPDADVVRYEVTVTEMATGCRQSLGIEVKSKDIVCEEPYIFVPNAFTPNSDGTNDVLYVEGFNIEEMYFTVYDRWGEMVFESNNKEDGWDGSFRGAPVSGDVYGYFLKVRCPGGRDFFKKGNITVIR